METPFPPFEPNGPPDDSGRGPRLREIPMRLVIPNLITILAICAGLTGIRLAFENRYELAVGMVLVAAFLDGIDGRIARLMKATSKFGAQMDSLADIVNFGVAPALVLYVFALDQARSLGWIAALIYAIAAGLRLACLPLRAPCWCCCRSILASSASPPTRPSAISPPPTRSSSPSC
jgi:CDP-diacylglycerol--serine O-phosphatidyltransferase